MANYEGVELEEIVPSVSVTDRKQIAPPCRENGDWVATHIIQGREVMKAQLGTTNSYRYFSPSGLPVFPSKKDPAIPLPDPFRPEQVKKAWVPTHKLDGEEVMRWHTPAGGYCYWNKAGYRLNPKVKGATLEELPREQMFSKPSSEAEAAYKRGVDRGMVIGYQRAMKEKGAEPVAAERKAAEFAVEDNAKQMCFRLRDVAAAIMAVLGAHEGTGWVHDPHNGEGELKALRPDGTYEVITRIFDWEKKCHYVHKLHLPREVWLDVIDDSPALEDLEVAEDPEE